MHYWPIPWQIYNLYYRGPTLLVRSSTSQTRINTTGVKTSSSQSRFNMTSEQTASHQMRVNTYTEVTRSSQTRFIVRVALKVTN